MLHTELFGQMLADKGYSFYSGVPCSFLKDLINYAVNEKTYVMAANEGDAVAVCAGASLAGKKSVVLMQNSGLGNAVSPLTSLNSIFNIPVLGFVSLRGEKGIPDEPQHDLMGIITDKLLSTMKIEWAYLSPETDEAAEQLKRADAVITNGKPFFFIVKKDTFSKVGLEKKVLPGVIELPPRREIIDFIAKNASEDAAFIATTGFTGRELYQVHDRKNNFYMVGSLGCASSIGLGICLAKPQQEVIVLDGDGSALMRMGSYAVNAAYKPQRFCHILFDNQAHESTGGQFTVSSSVDYPLLARSCGYEKVLDIKTLQELMEALNNWHKNGGCVFIYLKITQGTFENLVRPKIKPAEVAERFSAFLLETRTKKENI